MPGFFVASSVHFSGSGFTHHYTMVDTACVMPVSPDSVAEGREHTLASPATCSAGRVPLDMLSSGLAGRAWRLMDLPDATSRGPRFVKPVTSCRMIHVVITALYSQENLAWNV